MIEVRPLGPVLGAEIRGADLGSLTDEAFGLVREALVTHEVLVFRDQPISTAQHLAFGRRFGELTVSPFSPNAADAPELIVLDNRPGAPAPLTDVWHSDETFRETPPLATILRARVVPSFGGDTLFASMTAAYEGLSARMKLYLTGLEATHGHGRFAELLRADPARLALLHEVERTHPRRRHPVVRVHPESGRKALFVNPHFTLRIEELAEDESRAILDFLFRQALTPGISCG